MADPDGPSDSSPGSPPEGTPRRYRVRRADKRAAMAAQSWPEFLHDLGIRFLVVGAIVLVAVGLLWLLAR